MKNSRLVFFGLISEEHPTRELNQAAFGYIGTQYELYVNSKALLSIKQAN